MRPMSSSPTLAIPYPVPHPDGDQAAFSPLRRYWLATAQQDEDIHTKVDHQHIPL